MCPADPGLVYQATGGSVCRPVRARHVLAQHTPGSHREPREGRVQWSRRSSGDSGGFRVRQQFYVVLQGPREWREGKERESSNDNPAREQRARPRVTESH